jgi:poly(A) polymerase
VIDAKFYATEIVRKLVRAGYVAYFAGGWVRDYLMEHPSSDIDIATNAPPEVVVDIFPRTILVGLAFGVVIVAMDGHQFEVSTFRRDIAYLNGRKPEKIEFSTAEEDASRRDFTINGMFYDPLEDAVYDFVTGLEDIKKGVIRTIGDPFERFSEDRLRMIRAVRFACRFGFYIDSETQEGILENAHTLFPAVALERVWQEFCKMSQYPRFDHALIELHRLGLLPVIFPSLQSVHLTEIKKRVETFAHFPPKTPPILHLMELFPETPLQNLIETCQYLRTSVKEAELVEFLWNTREMVEKEKKNDPSLTAVDWVHFYADPRSPVVLGVLAARYPRDESQSFLTQHEQRKEKFKEHIDRLVQRKPLVSAHFLKEQGIPQGKIIGVLMKEAEKLAILQNMKSADEIMVHLIQSPYWPKKG